MVMRTDLWNGSVTVLPQSVNKLGTANHSKTPSSTRDEFRYDYGPLRSTIALVAIGSAKERDR